MTEGTVGIRFPIARMYLSPPSGPRCLHSLETNMNIKKLIDELLGLVNEGLGKEVVHIWDPDAKEWLPVTGLAYDHTLGVRLYADEP